MSGRYCGGSWVTCEDCGETVNRRACSQRWCFACALDHLGGGEAERQLDDCAEHARD